MRKFKAVYAKQYPKQDGSMGTSWKQLGYANEIISQDGKVTIHLSLDSMPTGQWDGEIKLFLQEEQDNQQQGGYNQPQQRNEPQYEYQDKQGRQTPQPQQNNSYRK
jgi:hypothetical protein